MKNEIFEKLKASDAVMKIKGDQFLYILANADANEKPRLFQFLLIDGQPLVKEFTEESVLLNIVGERDND